MKTTLLAFLVLCASAAFGQSFASVRSSEPNVVQLPSHQARASQHPLAQESNILFTSANISARGERPLWEFAQPRVEVPLGDVARMLREGHATVKKAVMVLEQ